MSPRSCNNTNPSDQQTDAEGNPISFGEGDLISFEDLYDLNGTSISPSEVIAGPRKVSTDHHLHTQPDSFSGLTDLVKVEDTDMPTSPSPRQPINASAIGELTCLRAAVKVH